MTNVITIEKNIPFPANYRGKYDFVEKMEIGDSFIINGNTPDFNPKTVKARIYAINNKQMARAVNRPMFNPKQYTIRTLGGHYSKPTSIRVWRTK